MASEGGDQGMPKDVIREVLLRLPVKSLMRFKCVCKHWQSFIRDSTFVTKHLNHKTHNARLLVQHYCYVTEKYGFALFHDENLAGEQPSYHNLDDLQMANDPGVIGPFHGLIGLWDWNRIALWNPAMKEFRPLQMAHPDFPPYFKAFSYYFGLGLDTAKNDYKVVWIRYYWDDKSDIPYFPAVVAVYSMSTDSWKIFETDKTYGRSVHDSLCNTFVDGVYYWLMVGSDPNYMILAFDMDGDVFREIPAPPDIPKSQWGELGMHNGSVALFLYDPHEVEKQIELWVMKDESWTKQFTLGPIADVEGALGFWKNGELFLETSTSELLMYNPTTQESKFIGLRGKDFCLRVYEFRESLVSVKRDTNGHPNEDNLTQMVRVQDFFKSNKET